MKGFNCCKILLSCLNKLTLQLEPVMGNLTIGGAGPAVPQRSASVRQIHLPASALENRLQQSTSAAAYGLSAATIAAECASELTDAFQAQRSRLSLEFGPEVGPEEAAQVDGFALQYRVA
ncbi:hypothetical protein AK812_SmicGene30268 [Symbiodinium microadriaticum]|uniref:Uncharacterized protein n=1 Tax=Symbiodinium microadriaticum TaxID=2951 RepID=A0A1Q9CZR8_SYMMI|nr:hypothetical protein AK812_SmicGene30268 [Symbiodinium microadriaticum]